MVTTPANPLDRAVRFPRPGLVMHQIMQRKRKKPVPHRAFFDEILGNFGLSILQPVEILAGAFRSETWLVRTNKGKKVLKRYRRNLSYDQIRHEHSILIHLSQMGFPTSCINFDDQGNTIVEKENRYYGLYDFLEGYDQFQNYFYLPNQDSQFLISLGATLGQLHQALKGFVPEGQNLFGFQPMGTQRFWDLDWYLDILHKCKSEVSSGKSSRDHPVNALLLNKSGWIEDRLLTLDDLLKNTPLEPQVIHGDFGPYNLLFKKGSPIIPIDFELARIEWRLIDLISAFSTSTWGKKKIHNIERIKRIAQGYLAENPIPREEIRLLPPVWQFILLRRVINCWDAYLNRGEVAQLEEALKRLSRYDWVIKFTRQLETLPGPA